MCKSMLTFTFNNLIKNTHKYPQNSLLLLNVKTHHCITQVQNWTHHETAQSSSHNYNLFLYNMS